MSTKKKNSLEKYSADDMCKFADELQHVWGIVHERDTEIETLKKANSRLRVIAQSMAHAFGDTEAGRKLREALDKDKT